MAFDETQNARIFELPVLPSLSPGALAAVWDPILGFTGQLDLSLFIPSSTTFPWVSNNPPGYALGALVTYDGKIWESLIVDNLGNVPIEGAGFWTERSKSVGGLVLWAAGVYTETENFVFRPLADVLQQFRLNPLTARPFSSTDFEVEYAAGTWVLVSDRTYAVASKVAHGFTVGKWLTITGGDWELCGATDNGLAQVVFEVDADTFIIQVKSQIITGLAGLTPFQTYYHDAAGAVTTVVNDNAAYIAISATTAIKMDSGGGGGSQNLEEVLTDGDDANGLDITDLGNLFMRGGGAIDVLATGGSDVLNIGTANADVINIGWANAQVNIQGDVFYQNVTNLQVSDKLITLNKGGAAASAVSSGIELEEGGVITGYWSTNGTRNGWDLKAPAISGVATLSLANLTGNHTYILPDAAGTFAVSASGNIALSAVGNITLTGTIPVANGGTGTATAFTQGSIVFAGVAGVYSQNNAKFFWNDADETLFIGNNATAFTGVKLNSIGTVNSYIQNNLQNLSNGSTASGDWIATADDGTDATKYIDLGINSSGWAGVGMIDGARQGYLYTKDVPLAIGTDGANSLKLFTGGTAAGNQRVSIDSSGNFIFSQTAQAVTNTFITFTQSVHTSGSPTALLFTGGAHTTLTAGVEAIDINLNLARTVQFTNGAAPAVQRAIYIQAPTYAHVAGTTRTITTAATLDISGAPAAGTATTITDSYALRTENGRILFNSPDATTTKGGLTIVDSSSSGKMMLDIKKSASVFTVYQEGRVKITVPSGSLATSTGLLDISGTLGYNIGNAAERADIIRLMTTAGTMVSSSTSIVGVMRLSPAIDFTGGASGNSLSGVEYSPTITAFAGGTHSAWKHDSGYIQWNSILSPAQITSNQNDYNPTGWQNGGAPNGASIIRINTDASRNLTSLTGGAAGRLTIVHNVGSFDLVIKNDDGSTGTAANRFKINADITLQPDEGLLFWYDATTARWRALTNA